MSKIITTERMRKGTAIRTIGTSNGVIIPKGLLKMLNWEKGDKITFVIGENNTIIMINWNNQNRMEI
jgi:antitoxin component of MazEF toxin-antitoxin module